MIGFYELLELKARKAIFLHSTKFLQSQPALVDLLTSKAGPLEGTLNIPVDTLEFLIGFELNAFWTSYIKKPWSIRLYQVKERLEFRQEFYPSFQRVFPYPYVLSLSIDCLFG